MDFYKGSKVLVVAAHPDDEILGCGGTLAKALSKNAEVMVMFLGEGVSARFPISEYDSIEFAKQTQTRIKSAKRSLDYLGINRVVFGERLCTQFDTYPLLSLVKEIELQIDKFRPNILLTHNPSEVNIDHRITYEAVEVACRPNREYTPNEIYTFEIPCSGSWTFETTFKPNIFVDIKEFWDIKLKAWSFYSSEERPFPFPRSKIGILTIAQYRGLSCNLEYVEAFKVVRKIC